MSNEEVKPANKNPNAPASQFPMSDKSSAEIETEKRNADSAKRMGDESYKSKEIMGDTKNKPVSPVQEPKN